MRKLIVQQWVTVDHIAAEEDGGLGVQQGVHEFQAPPQPDVLAALLLELPDGGGWVARHGRGGKVARGGVIQLRRGDELGEVVGVPSDLASLRGEGIVWYAFRRAFADPPDDHWWENGLSWAVIDAERVFVEASEGFAAIVEVPSALLIGMRIEDLASDIAPPSASETRRSEIARASPQPS